MKDFKKAISRLIGPLRLNSGGIWLFLSAVVFGVVFIVSGREKERVITHHYSKSDPPKTERILADRDSFYKLKERALMKKLSDLGNKLAVVEKKLVEKVEPVKELPKEPAVPKASASEPIIHATPQKEYKVYGVAKRSSPKPTRPKDGPAIITFPVKGKAKPKDLGVKIPSGSFMQAKLLTGVEAPEGKAYPVLLQAEYAFVGPNKSRVDLSGCFVVGKSTGNLSIERVEVQTQKISCVSNSGKMFERPISGFITDAQDSSFAVVGSVNSKRDRAAAMAFLSSIVDGISRAVGRAQTSVVENTNGVSTMNITGDEKKFIAASGASRAASVVTSWYLKHAESLLPTINVGSGRRVWIVVQDTVDLPNWYFRASKSASAKTGILGILE